MTNPHAVTTELFIAKQAEVMREFIKPGKYDEVSEGTGIDDRTIRAHILGDAGANGTKLMRYFAFFGPEFVNSVLAMIGMGGAHWINAAEETNEFMLNSKTVSLLKEISDALEDGRVDHQEKARILPVARHLLCALESYVHATNPHKKGTKK
jgi:hypothetical protein